MIADEANPEQTDATKFFIYGATWVPISALSAIHDGFETLLASNQLAVGEKIKFSSRSRPNALTNEQHTKLKQDVMRLAASNGVVFCGYAILHAIAKNKTAVELAQWGSDALLAKYNEFLHSKSSLGWAMFDRVDRGDPFGYLQTKFSQRAASDGSPVRLDRILGYSHICDGASHLSSLADILVGGLRYVINEPNHDIAGRSILREMKPLLWGLDGDNGVKNVHERGLLLRPKTVSYPPYYADYQEIRERLNRWSKEASKDT